MTKLKQYSLPIALFLLSLIIRISLISKGPYHIDCLYLTVQAEKTLATFTLHPMFGSGYPLTVILAAIFIALGKTIFQVDPVTAVNFMSVLTSSLCVGLLFLIAKKMLDGSSAFFSTLLFSLCPIFLGVSVYGKSHAPSLLFLLLCILSIQNKKIVAGALFFGLMGACRLQDMLLMILPILLLHALDLNPLGVPSEPKSKKITDSLKFLLLSSLIAVVFHLPFLLQESTHSFTEQMSRFWHAGITINFRGLISNSIVRSLQYLSINFLGLGLITIVIGFVLLAIKNRSSFIFLLFWFLIPSLFYANLYSTTPRFFTLILAPLCIAQGFFFKQFRQIKSPLRFASTFLFIYLLGSTFLFIYPILKYRHLHALLPAYVQWVDTKTEPHARIITTDESQFFHYYGNRKPLGRPIHHNASEYADLSQYFDRLDKLLNQEIPVYITDNSTYVYDPKSAFSFKLKQRYDLQYVDEALYEDWHPGSLIQHVFYNGLYKIRKKGSI